jgi:group I intron endonuclease
MKNTGIYMIKNELNGKVYIGSSINIKARWARHKTQLKNNIHTSKHLQSAYNKYGADKFFFEIIQYCDRNDLAKNEQWWIDHFNASNHKKGYNIKSIVNSTLKYDLTSLLKEAYIIHKTIFG